MVTIDSRRLVLTCADPARERRLPLYGSRRPPAFDGVPTVALPARPGRAELDPLLVEHDPQRVVVHGTDADLAAVLLRLLRTERLHVEIGYVPSSRRSAVAAIWGLGPVGTALHGRATAVPLVRDDTGGVLVGRGEVRDLDGECYCDDALVLRGRTPRLVVAPGPDGIAVRAGRGSRLPTGAVRPVAPTARRGRGSALGRAVQVGGRPFTAVSDGVAHPRPLERRTWYRHTSDWLLALP
ncbi:hypothetical protein GCM10017691_59370 [Pseudonocardia petroleophila]|uniref:hypothetical protein n=1 Tax=Pseudonocardia petroleophila TaxID=37331 RepID=UPI002104D3CA|nr:hypothetical protein [Pseudonocardia petroleophila]